MKIHIHIIIDLPEFSDSEVIACWTVEVRFAASRYFPLHQRSVLTIPQSKPAEAKLKG
jgi:hypothetical protein